jgi:DNA-binding NarL/FixJ family response regulator
MPVLALAQTDKKNLGAKAMMQEIKDIVEKRRQADTSLAAVSSAAPFAARLSPDLTYKYLDRSHHTPHPTLYLPDAVRHGGEDPKELNIRQNDRCSFMRLMLRHCTCLAS